MRFRPTRDMDGRQVFWPAFPPNQFEGQLDDAFQQRMSDVREALSLEDCRFYHTFRSASGDIIPGAWDLRGGENAYLGGIALAGKRVFELGPASGYLTFHMESQGASVVGFD